MSSCFYRDRPILCLCSFEGVLNASLRRATGDDFWLGYDPGVENLPGGRVIRRLRRDKLDAINEPLDGDFDIAGLSFATMLETSARIAVVAARDVRRKDRRVCMNRCRSILH